MINTGRIFPACVSMVIIISCCSRLMAQSPASFDMYGKHIQIAAFNREVNRMLDEAAVPGMSLAVIDHNRVVFYGTYGYRQWSLKDTVDKTTVFEAASLSKTYLLYAAYKLVEAGKLDLDKPLYQYCDPGPQLANHPYFKLITPRMVLSHSSGIENWQRYNNPDSLEIISKPGTRFVYSGTAYNLLADVIATILGKPYEEYIPELVLRPLGLKNSYVRFTAADTGASHKSIPWDYATGHDGFGKEFAKWKNNEAVPASGNNVTAEDYARLIIALFDKKHLTAKSVHTMLQPMIRTGDNAQAGSYGAGFDMRYIGNDTIVVHGGDNLGFKSQIFYSVPKACGFVFITNSERGRLVTTHLAQLLNGLDIADMYKGNYPDQYPSNAVSLFRTYLREGPAAMQAQLQAVREKKSLKESDLYALGWELIDHDRDVAEQLLQENTRLYPLSATTYGFLAELYYRKKKYDSAYRNYVIARDLHFKWWEVDKKIAECSSKAADAERRKNLSMRVNGNGETEIKAVDYNFMEGAEFGEMEDMGKQQKVAYLAEGNWLKFRTVVESAGNYQVSFRVSSLRGGNKLQLRQGGKLLATFDVAATRAWHNWVTLAATVPLAAGEEPLAIHATSPGGGFEINWMKLSPAGDH